MTVGLIDRIRARLAELPRKEGAVARAILANPDAALHVAIARLASDAGVSQPTVLRLCRSFGYPGFPEFKVALAQSLVAGVPFVSAHVAADDTAAAFAPKVIDAAMSALRHLRNRIDTDRVSQAVALLADARQILVAGYGGSAAIAIDSVHKLSRFPAPCRHLPDPLLATMAIEAAEAGDVLVAISNTGRTISILEAARAARSRGLAVVTITAPGSPLGDLASVALLSEPAEDAEMFTPMASRIAHLALIDVLMTGLAIRLGSNASDRLGRIKAALSTTRTSPGGAH
jgi:RpiR family carbohydrate utilization transcriptional regulator